MASDKLRSPLDMWRQFVPQGHDQSLRSAFYNVAAAVFVGGAGIAAWSVYIILQPFVQALMWAVLFGSVLHPVKYSITTAVNNWLHRIEENQSPLSVAVAMLPIQSLDSLSELVGCYVTNHMKYVVAVTVILPLTYIIIHFTPAVLSGLAYSLISFVYNFFHYFLTLVSYIHILILVLVAVYFYFVCNKWNVENQKVLRLLSLPVWISLSAVLSTYASETAAVPFFFFFCALLIGGTVIEAKDLQSEGSSEGKKQNILLVFVEIILGIAEYDKQKMCEGSTVSNISSEEDVSALPGEIKDERLEGTSGKLNESHLKEGAIEEVPEETVQDQEQTSSERKDEKNISELDSGKSQPHTDVPTSSGEKLGARSKSKDHIPLSSEFDSSNIYLKSVFLACVLVELWRHSYLLPLLPLALFYYTVKRSTLYHLYGKGYLKSHFKDYLSKVRSIVKDWFEERKDVLWPLPIRGLAKILRQSDRNIVGVLLSSVDVLVTLLVMLAVTAFLVLTTLFLAVQIQGEGMQLVAMGSQLINATIINNPKFHEMLPEGMNDIMESAVDNGYHYGREWISNKVKETLGETDEVKAEALEKQIVELWDRVYQAWVVTPPQYPTRGPTVTTEAIVLSLESIKEGFLKSPDLISLSSITDVLRENIGTVLSVLESLWAILVSNLSLALSVFSSASSLLLGSSLSILNGLINFVVFLSALFYVLSISGAVYKPVAILTSLAPGQINSIGSAFEDSINGVFRASFKMGAFYGMWTWLLHTVFDANIVYIPAVLGALFGAVPLVGTYWAAIPGVLELFWGHNSPFLALLLFGAQLLPLSCVDTAIYAEIKGGGHPYLTGLAVAGGIFCWGVQGAILGPLVLCILLVVTKIYTSLIQSPGDYSVRIKKLRRCASEVEMK